METSTFGISQQKASSKNRGKCLLSASNSRTFTRQMDWDSKFLRLIEWNSHLYICFMWCNFITLSSCDVQRLYFCVYFFWWMFLKHFFFRMNIYLRHNDFKFYWCWMMRLRLALLCKYNLSPHNTFHRSVLGRFVWGN